VKLQLFNFSSLCSNCANCVDLVSQICHKSMLDQLIPISERIKTTQLPYLEDPIDTIKT